MHKSLMKLLRQPVIRSPVRKFYYASISLLELILPNLLTAKANHRLGLYHWRHGRSLKAHSRFKALVAQPTAQFDALLAATEFFFSIEDFSNGQLAFSAMLSKQENIYFEGMYRRIGLLSFTFNEHQAMDKYYRLGADHSDEKAEIFHELGCNYQMMGELDKAISAFRKCAAESEQRARALGLDKLGVIFLTSYYWSRNIGHIAWLDFLVKLMILGELPANRIILLASDGEIANACYLRYWEQYIQVIKCQPTIQILYPIARITQEYIHIIKLKGSRYEFTYPACNRAELLWSETRRPPLLKLTAGHVNAGRSTLQKLSLPYGAWFVVLHIRGSGFKNESSSLSTRNAALSSYANAVDLILERGGHVVWMGESCDIPSRLEGRVINYADSNEKSEQMDVYLLAACRFYIGIDSGISIVPGTFGVPCVMTNWSPAFARPWAAADLWIPKLIWCEKEKRFLTWDEMVAPPVGLYETVRHFAEAGLRVVDNNSKEIADVVEEMLLRIEGKISYSKEDEALQHAFKAIAERHNSFGQARAGRAFLHGHHNILGLGDVLASEGNLVLP